MQLRERLAYARIAPPPRRNEPKQALVPPGFSRGENRLGEVYYRDQYLPPDQRHGKVPIGRATEIDPDLLARLGDGLTQSHIAEAAFLDIETTGLSGGTGTYAFLVGVGRFEAFSFRVRQFFLCEPSGEAAMLASVGETVERCRALVTFNGKSFDIPQLATRYAVNRLPALFSELPHIDLLHPARRLFGRRLDSCRLAEIERQVLGLRRPGDVPSWMIPGLYFAYVRRRDLGGLHPVFEHNSLDVISLAALIGHLSRIAGSRPREDIDQMLALGKWDEARGRPGQAASLYEAVWRLDAHGEEGREAVWRLGRLRRRFGDWERCRELWTEEEQRTTSLRRVLRAKVELAKLAEHRDRDIEHALELTVSAIQMLAANPEAARMLPETRQALAHRLNRLRRRSLSRPG